MYGVKEINKSETCVLNGVGYDVFGDANAHLALFLTKPKAF